MSAAEGLRLGLRFAGLVVVVPLAEELCWRGFFTHWLISEDFRGVPAGRMTVSSFFDCAGGIYVFASGDFGSSGVGFRNEFVVAAYGEFVGLRGCSCQYQPAAGSVYCDDAHLAFVVI